MTEVVTALVYDARGGVEGARRFVEASLSILAVNDKLAASETKLAVTVEDSTKKKSRALEALLRRYDPLYDAQKKLDQGLRSLATALAAGKINDEGFARAAHGLRLALDGNYAAAVRLNEAEKVRIAGLEKLKREIGETHDRERKLAEERERADEKLAAKRRIEGFSGITRAGEQPAGEAKASASAFGPIFEKEDRETLEAERKARELRDYVEALEPARRAQRLFDEAMAEANRRLADDEISLEQHALAIARASNELQRGTGEHRKAAQAAREHAAEIERLQRATEKAALAERAYLDRIRPAEGAQRKFNESIAEADRYLALHVRRIGEQKDSGLAAAEVDRQMADALKLHAEAAAQAWNELQRGLGVTQQLAREQREAAEAAREQAAEMERAAAATAKAAAAERAYVESIRPAEAAQRKFKEAIAEADRYLGTATARIEERMRTGLSAADAERELADALGLHAEASGKAYNALQRSIGVTKQAAAAQNDGADATNEQALAMERLAREAREIRDALDPTVAIQRNYNLEIEKANRALKAQTITEAEHTARIAQLNAEVKRNIETQRMWGMSSRFNSAQLSLLSFQVNDVISGLLGGQGIMQIAIQQGGQILQIMPEANAALIRFGRLLLTPAGLATGGIAAYIGAVAYNAYNAMAEIRRLGAELQGFGRSKGEAEGFRLAAREIRDYGASFDEAAKARDTFMRNSRVTDAVQATDLGKLAVDAGARFGIGTDKATELIDGMMKRGLPAIREAAQAYDFLDTNQVKTIVNLARAGEGTKALNMALDALKTKAKGAHDEAITPLAKAMHELGKAWRELIEASSKGVTFELVVLGADVIKGILKSTARDIENINRLAKGEGLLDENQKAAKRADLTAKIATEEMRLASAYYATTDSAAKVQASETRLLDLRTKLAALGTAKLKPTTASESEDKARGEGGGAQLAFETRKQLDTVEKLTEAERDNIRVMSVAANQRDRLRATIQAQKEAGDLLLTGKPYEIFVETRVNSLLATQAAAVRDVIDARTEQLTFIALETEALLAGNRALAIRIAAEAKAAEMFRGNDQYKQDAYAREELREKAMTAARGNATAIDEARRRNIALNDELLANGNVAMLERAKRQTEINDLLREEFDTARALQQKGGGDDALKEAERKKAEYEGIFKQRDDLNRNIRGASERKTLDDNLELARAEYEMLGLSNKERDRELAALRLRQQLVAAGYEGDALKREYELRLKSTQAIAEYNREIKEAEERERDFAQLAREGLLSVIEGFQQGIAEAKSFGDVLKTLEQSIGKLLLTFANKQIGNWFSKQLEDKNLWGSIEEFFGGGKKKPTPANENGSWDIAKGSGFSGDYWTPEASDALAKMNAMNVTASVVNVNGSVAGGPSLQTIAGPRGSATDTLSAPMLDESGEVLGESGEALGAAGSLLQEASEKGTLAAFDLTSAAGSLAQAATMMAAGGAGAGAGKAGVIGTLLQIGIKAGLAYFSGGTSLAADAAAAGAAQMGPALANMSTGVGASPYHSGGIVGVDGQSARIIPFPLGRVPRLHSGGTPDALPSSRFLAADERLAILQTGEEVLSRQQRAKKSAVQRDGGTVVKQTINITTPNADSFRASERQVLAQVNRMAWRSNRAAS